MNFVKKFMTIVLITFLIVPKLAVYTSADAGYITETNRKLQLLQAMDVIYKEDLEKPESDIMTRAEFAMTIVKLRGLKGFAQTLYNAGYFFDVENDYEETGYINAAAATGLMKPIREGFFEPKASVTYREVVYSLVRLLGLGVMVENSENPDLKAIELISQSGISGITLENPDAACQRGYIFTILSRAVDARVMVLSSVANQGGESLNSYKSGKNVTVLTEYHSIHNSKGLVFANERTSLETPLGNAGDGRVKIDDIILSDTKGVCGDYLGYSVEYYWRGSDDGEISEIVYALPYNTDTVRLTPGKIVSSSGMKLTYEDEKERVRTIDMRGAYIIYNGSATASGVDFTPKNGEVILIDNNGDGKYEVISIISYTELILESASANTKALYGKFGKKLDYSDIDNITATDTEQNKVINLQSIEKGTVVSGYVSADGNNAEIFVADRALKGTAAEIYKDSGTHVKIDGVTYEFSQTLDECVSDGRLDAVKIGNLYEWKLNHVGEIAYYERVSDVYTNYEFAYIMSAEKEKGLSGNYKIRLHSQYNTAIVCTLADKVCVDDVKISDKSKVFELLCKEGENGEKKSAVVPQVIRCKMTDKNEITHIDLASGEATGQDNLYVIYDARTDGALRYYQGARGFVNAANYAPVLAMTTAVPVFAVDAKSSAAVDASTKVDYTTAVNSFISGRSEPYDDFVMYGTSGDKINAECVLHYAAASPVFSSTDAFCLCLGISDVTDRDGEMKKQISYSTDGTVKKIIVSDDIDVDNIPYTDFDGALKNHKLTAGDVFRYIADISGEVTTIELDYSIKGNKILLPGKTGDTEYNRLVYPDHPTSASIHLVAGVLEKDSEYMRFAYDNPANPTYQGMSYLDTLFTGNGRVLIYSEKDKKVRRITSKDEIMDYKTVGDDCSKGVLVVRSLTPTFLFLYEE